MKINMSAVRKAVLAGKFEFSDGKVLVPSEGAILGGRYDGEIIRVNGAHEFFSDDNLICNEGLDAWLNIMLHGTTQITAWYLGIFEGNYTPVATVTAATVTSASTECTAYTSATRVAYDEAAASSQVTTNSASRSSFVFNATKTIYGCFLASASAKSATTGTLISATRFANSKAFDSGDELLLTYSLTAASA